MFEKIHDSVEVADDGVRSSHSQQRSDSSSTNGHGDDISFDGNFDGNEVMTFS